MTDTPFTLTSSEGRCSYCRRKCEVFPIRRSGGGSYNRASRTYRSSICGKCCLDLLPGAHRDTQPLGTTSQYDTERIIRICEVLIETQGDCEVGVRNMVEDPEAHFGFRNVVTMHSASSLVTAYDQRVEARRASGPTQT